MARYDKTQDINTPNTEKDIDKTKGEMSVREAAAMEMPIQGTEPRRAEIPMQQGSTGKSAGESVSEVIDHIFTLPFRAQLGILRTIAPKILGAMDARDRLGYLRDLDLEITKAESGEETYDVRPPAEQDIQGP